VVYCVTGKGIDVVVGDGKGGTRAQQQNAQQQNAQKRGPKKEGQHALNSRLPLAIDLHDHTA